MARNDRRWQRELREIRSDGARVELFEEVNDVQRVASGIGLVTRIVLFVIDMLLVRTNLVPRMRSVVISLKSYSLDLEEQLAVSRARIAELEHNARQSRDVRVKYDDHRRGRKLASFPPLDLPTDIENDNDVIFPDDAAGAA